MISSFGFVLLILKNLSTASAEVLSGRSALKYVDPLIGTVNGGIAC